MLVSYFIHLLHDSLLLLDKDQNLWGDLQSVRLWALPAVSGSHHSISLCLHVAEGVSKPFGVFQKDLYIFHLEELSQSPTSNTMALEVCKSMCELWGTQTFNHRAMPAEKVGCLVSCTKREEHRISFSGGWEGAYYKVQLYDSKSI